MASREETNKPGMVSTPKMQFLEADVGEGDQEFKAILGPVLKELQQSFDPQVQAEQ